MPQLYQSFLRIFITSKPSACILQIVHLFLSLLKILLEHPVPLRVIEYRLAVDIFATAFVFTFIVDHRCIYFPKLDRILCVWGWSLGLSLWT